jgi:lipopolysaccharide export system protein LptA
MRKATLIAAMAAAAAMTGAGMAQAQIAPRSNAPIDIAADQSEAFTQECRVVWSGDVEALQARTRLRATTLSVYSAKRGDECGETQRLVADGQVYYVTAERTVRADNAIYLATGETITLTGNVVVVQGKNVARADRVVIDLNTGQSQMFSNTKGRGSGKRVRGVFYPSGQPN